MLLRQPCQLHFCPRRCGDTSAYCCGTGNFGRLVYSGTYLVHSQTPLNYGGRCHRGLGRGQTLSSAVKHCLCDASRCQASNEHKTSSLLSVPADGLTATSQLYGRQCGLYARWLHVALITPDQFAIVDACMVTVGASRCYFCPKTTLFSHVFCGSPRDSKADLVLATFTGTLLEFSVCVSGCRRLFNDGIMRAIVFVLSKRALVYGCDDGHLPQY